MKHILLSMFTILITLTCCIIMYSLKVPDISLHVQQCEEQPENVKYLIQEDENKEVHADISKDKQQDTEYSSTNDYDETVANQNDDKEDYYKAPNYVSMVYESTAASSAYKNTSASSVKYEAAVSEVQNLLTLKEKLYLIGIARYLDSRDFSLIKKYITEGATQKELDGLWTQIKSKLPEDDYNKVYSIFLKYKR